MGGRVPGAEETYGRRAQSRDVGRGSGEPVAEKRWTGRPGGSGTKTPDRGKMLIRSQLQHERFDARTTDHSFKTSSSASTKRSTSVSVL
jgi:hypothetical protein